MNPDDSIADDLVPITPPESVSTPVRSAPASNSPPSIAYRSPCPRRPQSTHTVPPVLPRTLSWVRAPEFASPSPFRGPSPPRTSLRRLVGEFEYSTRVPRLLGVQTSCQRTPTTPKLRAGVSDSLEDEVVVLSASGDAADVVAVADGRAEEEEGEEEEEEGEKDEDEEEEDEEEAENDDRVEQTSSSSATCLRTRQKFLALLETTRDCDPLAPHFNGTHRPHQASSCSSSCVFGDDYQSQASVLEFFPRTHRRDRSQCQELSEVLQGGETPILASGEEEGQRLVNVNLNPNPRRMNPMSVDGRSGENVLPSWRSGWKAPFLELLSVSSATSKIFRVVSPICFIGFCLQLSFLSIDFRVLYGNRGSETYSETEERAKMGLQYVYGLLIDSTVFFQGGGGFGLWLMVHTLSIAAVVGAALLGAVLIFSTRSLRMRFRGAYLVGTKMFVTVFYVPLSSNLLRRAQSCSLNASGNLVIAGFGSVSDERCLEGTQLPPMFLSFVCFAVYALFVVTFAFLFPWRFIPILRAIRDGSFRKEEIGRNQKRWVSNFGDLLASRYASFVVVGVSVLMLLKFLVLDYRLAYVLSSLLVLVVMYVATIRFLPFVHISASFLMGLAISSAIGAQIASLATLLSSKISIALYLVVGCSLGVALILHPLVFGFRMGVLSYVARRVPDSLGKWYACSLFAADRIILDRFGTCASRVSSSGEPSAQAVAFVSAGIVRVELESLLRDLECTEQFNPVHFFAKFGPRARALFQSEHCLRCSPDLSLLLAIFRMCWCEVGICQDSARVHIRRCQKLEDEVRDVLRRLFGVLVSPRTSAFRVSALVTEPVLKRSDCLSEYRSVLRRFPGSEIAQKAYARFLEELCFETSTAEAIFLQQEGTTKTPTEHHQKPSVPRQSLSNSFRNRLCCLPFALCCSIVSWIMLFGLMIAFALAAGVGSINTAGELENVLRSGMNLHVGFSESYSHIQRSQLALAGWPNISNSDELQALKNATDLLLDDLDYVVSSLSLTVSDELRIPTTIPGLDFSGPLYDLIHVFADGCREIANGLDEYRNQTSILYSGLRRAMSSSLSRILDAIHAENMPGQYAYTGILGSTIFVPAMVIFVLLLIVVCLEWNSLRFLAVIPKDEVVDAYLRYGGTREDLLESISFSTSQRPTPLSILLIYIVVIVLCFAAACSFEMSRSLRLKETSHFSWLHSKISFAREADAAAHIFFVEFIHFANESRAQKDFVRSELVSAAQQMKDGSELIRFGNDENRGIDSDWEFTETFYTCGDDEDRRTSDECLSLHAYILRHYQLFLRVAKDESAEVSEHTWIHGGVSVLEDAFFELNGRVREKFRDIVWPLFSLTILGAFFGAVAVVFMTRLLPIIGVQRDVLVTIKSLFLFLSDGALRRSEMRLLIKSAREGLGPRRLALGTINEKQSRFIRMFGRATSLGIMTFSRLLSVSYINPTAMQMFGFRGPSEAAAVDVTDLFTDSSQLLEWIRSRTKKSDTFTIETRALSRASLLAGERLEQIPAPSSISHHETDFAVSVTVLRDGHEYLMLIRSMAKEESLLRLLDAERLRSKHLLSNIVPHKVAHEFSSTGRSSFVAYDACTLVFADIVDFTGLSSMLQPELLIQSLHRFFCGLDDIADYFGMEKIKTIGDCYFCCCGVPEWVSNHCEVSLRFSANVLEFVATFNEETAVPFRVRIGIHSGKVVGGVVGKSKWCYDLWGDSVNMASRMEATGLENKIQLSRDSFVQVHTLARFSKRVVEVKGKGLCRCYVFEEWLESAVPPDLRGLMHEQQETKTSEDTQFEGTSI